MQPTISPFHLYDFQKYNSLFYRNARCSVRQTSTTQQHINIQTIKLYINTSHWTKLIFLLFIRLISGHYYIVQYSGVRTHSDYFYNDSNVYCNLYRHTGKPI